jgi:hypothetical protein
MAKKKKSAKPKKKATSPQELFNDWWAKVASKKVEKIESAYLKENPDYDPEDDDMSDSGCVHRMMHEGEAENISYDESQTAFIQGFNNEKFDAGYLYCELDDIVAEAYEAGKAHAQN